MTRREFFRFLPEKPVMAMAQLYPPFLPAQVTPEQTAIILLNIEVQSLKFRVETIEECVSDCSIQQAVRGDV